MHRLPSFKEHIFQGKTFRGCLQIFYMRHESSIESKLRSLFNHRPNGKGMIYGHGIYPMVYSPNERDMGL